MSDLLRRLLGHCVSAEAPAEGAADTGGAPSAAPAPENAVDQGSAPAPGGEEAAPQVPAAKELSDADHTAAMAKAITEGLKDGTKAPPKDKPGQVSREDDAETPAERARKKVQADAKEKEEKEQADRLKGKKTDDFALSLEERRALGQSANRRFHDLIRYSKLNEQAIETLSQENVQLKQAKDTIMGVFAEHNIQSGEQLLPMLRFHSMITSGDFDQALKVVEHQRRWLMTKLGREGDGVDLVAPFADLKSAVEEGELTRERALEIAHHRRVAQEQQQRQQREQQGQSREQADAAQREDAYNQIVAWENSVSSEPGYAAKRVKINEMIKDLVAEYPPQLWLSTIKRLYSTVHAEPLQPIGGNGSSAPLRPGGGGGGLPAPKSMEEAIAGGLGYNPKSLRMN